MTGSGLPTSINRSTHRSYVRRKESLNIRAGNHGNGLGLDGADDADDGFGDDFDNFEEGGGDDDFGDFDDGLQEPVLVEESKSTQDIEPAPMTSSLPSFVSSLLSNETVITRLIVHSVG